jgi:hypothetical protein
MSIYKPLADERGTPENSENRMVSTKLKLASEGPSAAVRNPIPNRVLSTTSDIKNRMTTASPVR